MSRTSSWIRSIPSRGSSTWTRKTCASVAWVWISSGRESTVRRSGSTRCRVATGTTRTTCTSRPTTIARSTYTMATRARTRTRRRAPTICGPAPSFSASWCAMAMGLTRSSLRTRGGGCSTGLRDRRRTGVCSRASTGTATRSRSSTAVGRRRGWRWCGTRSTATFTLATTRRAGWMRWWISRGGCGATCTTGPAKAAAARGISRRSSCRR